VCKKIKIKAKVKIVETKAKTKVVETKAKTFVFFPKTDQRRLIKGLKIKGLNLKIY
jgi:hypothetical protein